MGEHNVLGNGKAKAGASGFARAGFVDTIEAFEQARKVLRGDARAKILDEEFHGVGNDAGSQDNPPTRTPYFAPYFSALSIKFAKTW